MTRSNFVVFIVTHERANIQTTYESLKKQGYTGNVFFVIDNTDVQKNEYFDLYGDAVLMFDKKEYEEKTDALTNRINLPSAVYARAAVEDFAKALNLDFFLELDDDFFGFTKRYKIDGKLKSEKITNMDDIIEMYIDYMERTNIACIGLTNSATFIGGVDAYDKQPSRRCFGAFLRRTNIDITWKSAMNEDYITSVCEGACGKIFQQLPFVHFSAKDTAKGNKGGCEYMYEQMHEYERAFYSVIANPCAFLVEQTKKGYRMRSKGNILPKIISEKLKK